MTEEGAPADDLFSAGPGTGGILGRSALGIGGIEPIRDPIPGIPHHVVEAEVVCLERTGGCGAGVSIFGGILFGKLALPDVAAMFALHPMNVESVAWVSERKNVLSTFFWILTLWAYMRYVQQMDIKRYLLVALFFALGLMSKPMLVTLPFVLLLLFLIHRLKHFCIYLQEFEYFLPIA